MALKFTGFGLAVRPEHRPVGPAAADRLGDSLTPEHRPAWRLAAASVAGASHVAAKLPCQDAHATLLSGGPDPVLVIAVSDGAGSAVSGGTGAALTVAAIIEQAKAHFDHGGRTGELQQADIAAWLDGVRERIAEHAGCADAAMPDYAATLLVAILGPDAAVFAQIGDGAMVVAEADGGWTAVFWPQHGEYANTTYFVTEDRAHAQLEFVKRDCPIAEIAVFTDGLEQLALDHRTRAAHSPFFGRMLTPIRVAEGQGEKPDLSQFLQLFLTSPQITARAGDDLTLVVASRLRPGDVNFPVSFVIATDVPDTPIHTDLL